ALEPTKLVVATANAPVGGTTRLFATLTDSATNAPLANKTITFSVGGHVVGTGTTNANGVASLANVSAAGDAVGSSPGAVTASFAGDAGAVPATGAGTLRVYDPTVPELVPVGANVSTRPILTVGDSVGGYRMVGIPDGLGAFDNGDGTFTVL